MTREFLCRFRPGFLLAFGLFFRCGDAVAQPALLQLADPGSFRETLLDSIPPPSRGLLVGATIVGVRLDAPDREFEPKAVKVVLGNSAAVNGLLCVRYISRDGRYSAQARYKLGAGMDVEPVLETKTAYAKQLAGYKSSDIAVVARSSKSCDDLKAANLFTVDLGTASSGQIVVQLNAGDARVRAQVGQNNAAYSEPVFCAAVAGDVRIGFTQECRIKLPANTKPGLYQLSIGETATTGEISVKTYALALYRTADSFAK